MKVNNVYAEEIAKWDGVKATKAFSVLWDDPESGADLKVVYRTPRLVGSIMLVIGLAAIAGAAFIGWLSLHDATVDVLPGCCLILLFGVCVAIGALRTGFTRMEYEFKRGICTVRYALAGILRREWSFAYCDTTILFGHMLPMSAALATVPEYGFSDGEGNVLFRTKQAMKVENFDYFGLVVSGYLARNEDEEKSRRAIASIRLERNLRDKSASKKMWIFVGIVIAISATMSIINIRSKPMENERLAVKAVIEAFYNGGDYRAVAEAQKAKCRKRAQEDINETLDYCAEFSAARQELQEAGAIADTSRRREALQGLSTRLRKRVKAMKDVRRRSVASYVFENSFESLAVTAEAFLTLQNPSIDVQHVPFEAEGIPLDETMEHSPTATLELRLCHPENNRLQREMKANGRLTDEVLAAAPQIEGYRLMRVRGKDDSVCYVCDDVELSMDDFVSARASQLPFNEGFYEVSAKLTPEGRGRLARLTRDYKPHGAKNSSGRGRALAIVVNGELVVAPIILGEIDMGEFVITGEFTKEEAIALAAAFNSKGGE